MAILLAKRADHRAVFIFDFSQRENAFVDLIVRPLDIQQMLPRFHFNLSAWSEVDIDRFDILPLAVPTIVRLLRQIVIRIDAARAVGRSAVSQPQVVFFAFLKNLVDVFKRDGVVFPPGLQKDF